MDSSRFGPLAIVVVNYGSHAMLDSNLLPLAQQASDALVVVVDNFSSAQEREIVSDMCRRHGWLLAAPESNLGFGAGVNLGACAAIDHGAESLLLLNPDASIGISSLNQMREELKRNSSLLLAPKIIRPDGSPWFSGSVLDMDRGETMSQARAAARGTGRYEPWLTGACLLVHAQAWHRLHGFDERYFLYWEDVDLSYRATAAGIGLKVVPGATATHAEGGTHMDAAAGNRAGAARAKSGTYYYFNIRNRLLFAAIHLSDADRRKWIRSAPGAAYEVLIRGGRRQLVASLRPWAAAVRGTVNGMRLIRRRRRSRREMWSSSS